MKRIFSILLVVMLLVSAVPAAYATNDYTAGTKVEYTAANQEAYTITVPASMQPGDEGTVTLQGTWASDRIVTVTADKTVTLTNSINAADQKTLDIGFAGMEYAGNNTESKTYTETVSVAEMPASALFGVWSGKFNYNVEAATVIADGEVYTEGDYKYTYSAADGGWAVALNTEVTNKFQPSYGEILESINGKPVVSMNHTFAGCSQLITAPAIPDNVTNMDSTFMHCYNLEIAPKIPNGVTNMNATFGSCDQLRTAPTIPSSVTNMDNTFGWCDNLTTAPTIPNGVTSMRYTFEKCPSLTTYAGSTDANGDFSNYIIPSSVTNMFKTFSECTAIAKAPTIPSSVTNANQTFSFCESLTGEISIPCSLASENYTYTDCSATVTYYHIDGCDGSCGK